MHTKLRGILGSPPSTLSGSILACPAGWDVAQHAHRGAKRPLLLLAARGGVCHPPTHVHAVLVKGAGAVDAAEGRGGALPHVLLQLGLRCGKWERKWVGRGVGAGLLAWGPTRAHAAAARCPSQLGGTAAGCAEAPVTFLMESPQLSQ